MTSFTESTVKDAAFPWPESLGFMVKRGPEITPGNTWAEHAGGTSCRLMWPTAARALV